jgi:signal transduction histidine kinase
VEDDGKGFDSVNFGGNKPFGGNGQGDGNGLWNMQHRMNQHNNTLQIISSPGIGCKIIAEGTLS